MRDLYKQASEKMEKGDQVIIATQLSFKGDHQGDIIKKEMLNPDEIIKKYTPRFGELEDNLVSNQIKYIKNNHQAALLIEPCIPEPRLFILGGGHIAVPLVDFASKVGFRCIVVDDRLTFTHPDRFPKAYETHCSSFDDFTNQWQLRETDFVVLVTRGHRHDFGLLKQVIEKDLAYLGMIGSKRRVTNIKRLLVEEGVDERHFEKLNAPIGLSIGAVSPSEIAISITSELIRYKNMNEYKRTKHHLESSNFELQVAQAIADPSDMPRALITILSAKGSVPRKAGTKMVTFMDGTSIGSIGGGCSESEVVTLARGMMEEGGFKIHRLDMTGDAAEDEGMVCGGIMDVLIEIL